VNLPRALEADRDQNPPRPESQSARRGALAGDYVGADASVSAGARAGAGANALVGGFDRSFILQPLSVEVQSGVALAAGVTSLSLRTAP
jgi:hypothetical protein